MSEFLNGPNEVMLEKAARKLVKLKLQTSSDRRGTAWSLASLSLVAAEVQGLEPVISTRIVMRCPILQLEAVALINRSASLSLSQTFQLFQFDFDDLHPAIAPFPVEKPVRM